MNAIEELFYAYKQSNGDGVGVGKAIIIQEAEAELARITAERDAYKRIIDDVHAGNYDNAHDITAARKFIFAELGKMPR